MSTASWGLLDLDVCPSCYSMEFLWTHSLANDSHFRESPLRCRGCHRSALHWILRSEENEGLISDINHLIGTSEATPTHIPFINEATPCGICGDYLPRETTHRRYTATDAISSDCTTIVQVHQQCSTQCVSCNNHYAQSRGGENSISLAFL